MQNIDFNTVALIVLALIQCYNTWLTLKTEKNTNSLMDALLEKTAEDAKAEGVVQGREEERNNNPG